MKRGINTPLINQNESTNGRFSSRPTEPASGRFSSGLVNQADGRFPFIPVNQADERFPFIPVNQADERFLSGPTRPKPVAGNDSSGWFRSHVVVNIPKKQQIVRRSSCFLYFLYLL
jgi:hypothetical protein